MFFELSTRRRVTSELSSIPSSSGEMGAQLNKQELENTGGHKYNTLQTVYSLPPQDTGA